MSRKQRRVVVGRLEDVDDLSEGIEHGLPVISRSRLEIVERRLSLSLAQAGVEDRLGEAGRDAPEKARRVERVFGVERPDIGTA